jgi:hypothetical protein
MEEVDKFRKIQNWKVLEDKTNKIFSKNLKI